MELELTGKVALITGGSKGIGKEMALTFAKAGARVMIVSRKADALAVAAEEINSALESTHDSQPCAWFAANTGDPEAAELAIAATIERFGTLDILVNNAATNPYVGPMIEVDLPRWNKTIQVNLTAPLIWSQAAWNASMKEKGGVILNISSVGAKGTSQTIGVYDLTKSALLHLTNQLAAELGPKVRVNAICPGLIKTDFAKYLWEGEAGKQVADSNPLKRLGETEDVANAALYLVSDASSWMTGQSIILDGGGMIAFRERNRGTLIDTPEG